METVGNNQALEFIQPTRSPIAQALSASGDGEVKKLDRGGRCGRLTAELWQNKLFKNRAQFEETSGQRHLTDHSIGAPRNEVSEMGVKK